jgi:hypothetical protein
LNEARGKPPSETNKKEKPNQMKKEIEIKGRITVTSELFAKFKKIQAEKGALEKEIKKLQADMNLPEATAENAGTWIIANGNGDEQGKATIFARAEFVMPACVIRKVS